jgi:hypothetical protein
MYILTHEYYDYEGTYTTILGVFDSDETVLKAQAEYTQKLLDTYNSRASCEICNYGRVWHTEYVERLIAAGVKEHTFQPRLVAKLNDNEEVVFRDYAVNVLEDV